MKPLLTLCLFLLAFICQAQQPFSISFELSNGVVRDTVTVGYNPIATNVIDPQLGEVDITGTPRKVVDIRSIAQPTNCIFDTAYSGFAGFYETKMDFKPGFFGIRNAPNSRLANYGLNIQSFDSNTFYFICTMPPQRCSFSLIDQLDGTNSAPYYFSFGSSNRQDCNTFFSSFITYSATPGTVLFDFNLNSSRVDTSVIISFTRFNITTSLPKSLSAAGLKLRNHTLTATTALKPDRIEVVDYLGRVQHESAWSAEQPDYELPVREGIWFLRLYYGGRATVVKVRVGQ